MLNQDSMTLILTLVNLDIFFYIVITYQTVGRHGPSGRTVPGSVGSVSPLAPETGRASRR